MVSSRSCFEKWQDGLRPGSKHVYDTCPMIISRCQSSMRAPSYDGESYYDGQSKKMKG